MRKIIFVCTGNTCRSPMAEAIFNKKSDNNLFEAKSAGILVNMASTGAANNAILVLKDEYGVDLSAHRPKELTFSDIEDADLILCMEKMQAEIVKYKFSLNNELMNKVHPFLEYVGIGGDILDPYGGTYSTYLETARQIEKGIDVLLEKLMSTNDKGGTKMIAIGADHGGFALKEELLKYYGNLSNNDILLKDFGTFDETRGLEEPEVALKVAKSVANGECEAGVLICRSGIGMVMAANKVKGIRCGLAYNEEVAKSIKEHNDANIIALGADFTSLEQAIKYIQTWHNAKFLNGIYKERLDIISEYEKNN